MQAIFFAMVSYFGWGIGDIFGTIATRKINPYSTAIWYAIFSAIILLPLCFIYLKNLNSITFSILALNIALGIIGNISLIIFYEALRTSNATLIGTITSSFAAITVVLSIIFLGDRITLAQAIAIAVIFSGIILCTLDFKEIKTGKFIRDKAVVLALIAMSLWGVYWTFIKIPINSLGWFWPGFISILSFPVIFIPMLIKKISLENPFKKGIFTPLILNAVLLSTAGLSFNLGIEKGLTAIVAPIAGAYPTLFAVCAFWVFKDPITKKEIGGILITLIGIVMLSVFSF